MLTMATWRYSRAGGAEMAAVSEAIQEASACGNSSSSSSSSEIPDHFDDENTEDLSYSDLNEFPKFLLERSAELRSVHLDHNNMSVFPPEIELFASLVSLDLSNNCLKSIADEFCNLRHLRAFVARNNCLTVESIPKEFGSLPSLAVLNLSGNQLGGIPFQFTELPQLKCLYLGANQILSIPIEIRNMTKLEILYLGGNQLSTVPDELGYVTSLLSLVLCDNQLENLPRSLINLRRLQSLSLHNNHLSTLPPEIIRLNLAELSLRNNPLVAQFANEMTYEAPTLLELAGRTVKLNCIPYSTDDIPSTMVTYLDSAQSCVNPKCKGVYFSSRIEHVKFVDFCGKYRLPLMHYLCSPRCHASRVYAAEAATSEEAAVHPVSNRINKVLLG